MVGLQNQFEIGQVPCYRKLATKKRVRILIAKVFHKSKDYSNKEQNLALVKDDLIIKCGEGYLAIRLLQVEGKVPVKAKEFVNGYKTSCFLNDQKN